MLFSLGALFAFAAIFLWGGGDFLIQKTTRAIGDWETLFFIVIFGALILTPFVYPSLIGYLRHPLTLAALLVLSIFMFVCAILDFEALKKGKIAAIEPFLSLEIPVVAILSLFIINEALNSLELLVIIVLFIGLGLVSFRSEHFWKLRSLERGVMLAIVAAIIMGTASFLVGYTSRLTSPLIVNWFFNIMLTVYTLAYLLYKGKAHKMLKDAAKIPKLLLSTLVFDNLAWISYAFATILIPITIALTISESYIIVAVVLGLVVNKEKFGSHQKLGLLIAIPSAIALAILAS
ncbi:MAG: DMT family transporter [Candidatus Micrarchaeota archaeon]|nr:DMT family transporter [Candidatus Micrarchaeota archaeon]MDE1847725.1 DMT family transporter [Candidatus Micrarchaeota archaeon]MDE1864154.1 DMT family transporter [Candidatus Micrarchaeota archaeon]